MVFILRVFALLFLSAAFSLAQQDPAADRCPAVPPKPILSKLTDPFTFFNKRPVRTKADWECRRAEIREFLQRYQLGPLPTKPPTSVTGQLLENGTFSVTVTEGDVNVTFTAQIQLPTVDAVGGPKDGIPAIIAVGLPTIPIPPDVAVITFNMVEIAHSTGLPSRGKGIFYDLYGSDHPAGGLIAWSWGVSRLIDALEKHPETGINAQRLGVAGCSRMGKGAMVIGAFEPRIKLTIPQESGAGGSACWRISDHLLHTRGINTQTAGQIVKENVWFGPAFDSYTGQIGVLPIDQHLLAALIAPRALLVEENTGIDWLGPESVWGCQRAARTVWRALGVADRMGLSLPSGHNHCTLPETSKPYVEAFIDRFLKDKEKVNTTVFYTSTEFPEYKDKDWIDWDVPRF
ncbi:hypothetical protein H1R20_g878, partial [Candolleomyces eurysporus]